MTCIKWNLYDIFILVSVNSNSEPKSLKMATAPVPSMDENTIRASSLQVKRTSTHIYFFGYEGPDPEVCFQKWYLSSFTDAELTGSPSFPTSEHYMMYRKALLFWRRGRGEEDISCRDAWRSKNSCTAGRA
jgi:hypothetical protein